MTHLSLFSGIGGIDLAAHWAGFETVAFVEKDLFCQAVLRKNFPGTPIHDDITTFDGTRLRGIDLLSGGFPCQPFSVAGQRRGIDDERHLWPQMLRVISEAEPRWIVGENVPGILSIDGGRVFGEIVSGLADLGYRVGWGVLSAYAVGACHIRKRVFIVAYADQGLGQDGGRDRVAGMLAPPNGEAEGNRASSVCATAPCSPSRCDASDPQCVRCEGNLESKRGDGAQIKGGMQVPVGSLSDPGSCGRPRESRRGAGSVTENGYAPLQGRDWRSWGIEPIVPRGDDGLSSGVDSTNRVRTLGNAVVPQQVYPILKAIADEIRSLPHDPRSRRDPGEDYENETHNDSGSW